MLKSSSDERTSILSMYWIFLEANLIELRNPLRLFNVLDMYLQEACPTFCSEPLGATEVMRKAKLGCDGVSQSPVFGVQPVWRGSPDLVAGLSAFGEHFDYNVLII